MESGRVGLAAVEFPSSLPETGVPDETILEQFTLLIDQYSTKLDDGLAFAHMDPPPTTVAASIVALNAKYNQNLLHPELSPLATLAEETAVQWLAPFFGMQDGHGCSGSTVANLTALWCAREHGAERIVASVDAHISVAKSAHILGMEFFACAVDVTGKIQLETTTLSDSDCLVLTAGTTSRGAIDRLHRPTVKWLHIDAAWAAPLRLTQYKSRLDGIDLADSVSVSAHKWFYQPKDSALIFFNNVEAKAKVSFGGDYLAVPNVGVQGSRGAAGLALLASLLASGRRGLAQAIEKNMQQAETLAEFLSAHAQVQLKQMPETAVLNWRPKHRDIQSVASALSGTCSKTHIDGEPWLRQVAANPKADMERIMESIDAALVG